MTNESPVKISGGAAALPGTHLTTGPPKAGRRQRMNPTRHCRRVLSGARYGLPRGLIIILGLAAGVVVAAGMRAIPGIIGPVFMALVLTITVEPDPRLAAAAGRPGRWPHWRCS